MRESSKVFVGMDVQKESIDMTVAEVGGDSPMGSDWLGSGGAGEGCAQA